MRPESASASCRSTRATPGRLSPDGSSPVSANSAPHRTGRRPVHASASSTHRQAPYGGRVAPPAKWVAACNRMDEVWVPSAFNLESFSRAGVARHKLHRVPEGIDVERFSGSISPLPNPGRRRFNFLSVFDWHLRKGWDVLLRSFIEEFTPSEDVALIIKVWPPLEHIRQEARVFLRRHALARGLPSAG